MSSVSELFAYLVIVNDEEEIATYRVQQEDVQLVALDRRQALAMQPMARTIANFSRVPLRLVRFAKAEELDVVEPVMS